MTLRISPVPMPEGGPIYFRFPFCGGTLKVTVALSFMERLFSISEFRGYLGGLELATINDCSSLNWPTGQLADIGGG